MLLLRYGSNNRYISEWCRLPRVATHLLFQNEALTILHIRVITDRFGLPPSLPQSTPCDVTQQTFCGGTWKGIISNLDYIQSMGFTAIWISPVHKNYDGARTAYGDPYHGYWVTDIGQLNDRFGTSQDLKQLSDEVHRRGMLFMVDVVVNHVASLTTSPTDFSQYYFKNQVCLSV